MEYVYAAMILHSAGKTIDEKGITAVLESAGVDVDAARVKGLVASLASVDIEEAMSTAIAAPVAAATPAAGSGGGSSEAAAQLRKLLKRKRRMTPGLKAWAPSLAKCNINSATIENPC